MIKTRILCFVTFALALSGTLSAQENPEGKSDKEPIMKAPPGFWQASLPGGVYLIALDKITSVSRHKYLLDNTLIVDEVTIDTFGQSLARFYFIKPLSPDVAVTPDAIIERGSGLLDTAGQTGKVDVQTMVIKKYPETTHARTIEYRLTTEAQLSGLFKSATDCWKSGKNGDFTVGTKQ